MYRPLPADSRPDRASLFHWVPRRNAARLVAVSQAIPRRRVLRHGERALCDPTAAVVARERWRQGWAARQNGGLQVVGATGRIAERDFRTEPGKPREPGGPRKSVHVVREPSRRNGRPTATVTRPDESA